MILRDDRERHEHVHKVVIYEPGQEGKLTPEYVEDENNDVIDSYYHLRAMESERLQKELREQQISPVSFFIQYCNMTVLDTAVRMGLSPWRVKKHMTPKGFAKVDVATLQKYARLFDVGIADFFQFTRVKGDLEVSTERFAERLVQYVAVSARRPKEEPR
jgi:hypothetical protein